MLLPSNVSTGRVEGRFIVAIVDGADADDEPDVIAAKGSVTFTSSVPYLPNPTALPAPVTILKTSIVTLLDAEGYLCTPDPVDPTKAGARGVRLFATDDPDLMVQNWTWSVTYRFDSVNGTTPAIAAHSISLPEGAVVDLTTAVKVPSSPGVGVPQAEAAVLRAEAAALAAAEDAQVARDVKASADAGEFDGAVGPAGNATMRVDNTVGKRVFISDGVTEELVRADTGWRALTRWDSEGIVTGLEIETGAGYEPRPGAHGGLYIRRNGSDVTYQILAAKTTMSSQKWPIPNGFNGNGPPWPQGVALFSGSTTGKYLSGGSLIYSLFEAGQVSNDSYAVEMKWSSTLSWPSALPGSAHGTIPEL